jgi:hypothetical protein
MPSPEVGSPKATDAAVVYRYDRLTSVSISLSEFGRSVAPLPHAPAHSVQGVEQLMATPRAADRHARRSFVQEQSPAELPGLREV